MAGVAPPTPSAYNVPPYPPPPPPGYAPQGYAPTGALGAPGAPAVTSPPPRAGLPGWAIALIAGVGLLLIVGIVFALVGGGSGGGTGTGTGTATRTSTSTRTGTVTGVGTATGTPTGIIGTGTGTNTSTLVTIDGFLKPATSPTPLFTNSATSSGSTPTVVTCNTQTWRIVYNPTTNIGHILNITTNLYLSAELDGSVRMVSSQGAGTVLSFDTNPTFQTQVLIQTIAGKWLTVAGTAGSSLTQATLSSSAVKWFMTGAGCVSPGTQTGTSTGTGAPTPDWIVSMGPNQNQYVLSAAGNGLPVAINSPDNNVWKTIPSPTVGGRFLMYNKGQNLYLSAGDSNTGFSITTVAKNPETDNMTAESFLLSSFGAAFLLQTYLGGYLHIDIPELFGTPTIDGNGTLAQADEVTVWLQQVGTS